jgi:cobalt-zinc-cadmium efflux system membrane fusion protein
MTFDKELTMRVGFKTAGFILLILVVLIVITVATGGVPIAWQASVVAAMGGVRMPWQQAVDEARPGPAKTAAPGVELIKEPPNTLYVPEEVRESLGIRKNGVELITVAKKPARSHSLVMPGSTALDPTRLFRIRARFAPSPSSAEVTEIAQVAEDSTRTGKVETVFREIRSGDKVQKGDLLAMFHSVDVGNKKNDLIDAIYQLKLDEEILKAAEAKAEAVPEVFLWNARRNVQGDVNTINRAVSTLKTWGIPEADIQAVRDEAEEVKKRQGKHDPAKDAQWARVELRAPDDGVIIERNVSLHEIVVDNTTNLFQIAKVDRLSVFANVPEDDLPALEALPTEKRRWTVRTVGSDPLPGFIDDISYLIDPNQHTAVVKGHIENKEGKLRGGQFVSAAVELPAPPDVVEVPSDAVVDDGQQCVVFVQTDPTNQHYTMRRIELRQRFDKTVFVRSKPFPKADQRSPEEEELGLLPKEPLRAGERILGTGVGELKAVLLDKASQPEKEAP